ncbi:3-hydroxyacyl-CoA dehydrogenase family protein [Streptomyces cyanogenus]|uniref:3-hydroxybutyryl-CoA dehydrogenase n=1 Tax=Streptomyces cyanogenus TaxID=80860 RepID=A0ABX7TJ82_STRCY|nr:3-hydroxyacyl-CoA dehydrogenase family protein [Streptomyces cyanogenus]QTD96685.1 3-hydroxybutyryl-CoA dehydrogenase [Streptomyces cyanogenus]
MTTADSASNAPADRAGLPFRRTAVIGLGTVGSGLVRALAAAGAHVTAVEADATRLADARTRIAGGPSAPDRITFTTGTALPADTELVVEAVPERLALKAAVLRTAAERCGLDTVFATTTSLSVAAVGTAAGLLTRTVGLHPVGHGPDGGAIEVIPAHATEAAVVRDAERLVAALDRTAVRAVDRPGFLSGGLLMAYLNGALALYERRYASRDDIDGAMRLGCGLPLGPLAHLDRIGLDSALDTLRGLYDLTGERRFLPSPVLGHMVAAGLLGMKSGRGFYRYPPGPTADAPAAGPVTAPRPVATVGVVGSGTMATGIAEVFARSGLPTTLVARTEVRAKGALDRVAGSLDRAVRRGKVSSDDARAAQERLRGCAHIESVAGCDLVVEAVAEELPVKREVFGRLDAVCRPGAVLATTTSSLPIVECATATARPEDVLGLHFFNPAPVMRLVEVVGTVLTAPDASATARAVCGRIGKHPVEVEDRPGFLVNALLFPYLNDAVRLLEEHRAPAGDLDAVMTVGCGYPMGPLALLDTIGLDVSLHIQRGLHRASHEPSLTPARPLEDLVAAGHLGRKSGHGFHRYR